MSRKKKKHVSGHPANRARTHPLSRRNERRTILAEFSRWYDQKSEPEEPPSGEEIAAVLDLIWPGRGADEPRLPLTNPDPDDLDDLLTIFAEHSDTDDDQDMLYPVITTVHEYLHFLQDQRLWSGTADDLAECLEIAHDFLGELESPLTVLDLVLESLPEVSTEARRSAMEPLPIVRAVRELLDWIGRSRPITTSGVLRLADIENAASLLGIAAVGRRSPKPALPMLDLGIGLGAPERTDEPLQVASMRDIPELDAWWHALVDLQIIETTSTTVRPGPQAAAWLSAGPEESLDLGDYVVGAYLSGVFTQQLEGRGPMRWFALPIANDLMAKVLTALRPDVEADKSSADLLPAPVTELFGLRTHVVMQELEGVGLMDLQPTSNDGVRYIVPEGLRPAVAAILPSIGEQLLGGNDGGYGLQM